MQKISVDAAATKVYGSSTTIGARQTMLLLQIGAMQGTRQSTLDDINGRPVRPSVEALKARGLVLQRGKVLRLSKSGEAAAESLRAIAVPADSRVGLVLSGCRDKR